MNVTELVTATGCGQANVSKHLTQLAKSGFLIRHMHGTRAYSRIAGPKIYAICDIVSGKIADLLGAQRARQAALRSVAQKSGETRKFAPGEGQRVYRCCMKTLTPACPPAGEEEKSLALIGAFYPFAAIRAANVTYGAITGSHAAKR